MRDIEELLPEVAIHARSVPEPVALRYIRDSIREMCRRTKVWREWDEFKVSAPDYEALVTYPYARVLSIESATMDGQKLEPKSPDWLDARCPGWGETTEDTGTPRYITQLQPNQIVIVPRAEGTLRVRLVLTLSKDADVVPDFMVEDYGTEIGMGAVGKVLALPRTEYADPQRALYHQGEFDKAIVDITRRVAKGQQRTPLRTKARFF